MSAEIDEVRAVAAVLEADRDQWRGYAQHLETRLKQAEELAGLAEDYIRRLEDGFV